MKLQNLATLAALAPYTLGFPHLADFPDHRSLAGLSPEEVHTVVRTFSSTPGAQPLPPPINDTSAKLVNDADHPFQPDQPGDIRGPCPGLNTLASHGYLPRNGVATPAQIITAAQEGFNMAWNTASFATYAAFITDGNHLTNLMSIGTNTTTDGELTTGLNTHNHAEGDASTTREDFYLGNNWMFNEDLFQLLEHYANLVGDGVITIESAILDKAHRINDSIARNPTFYFESPRYITALGEATFPLAMFVSNQTEGSTLNLTVDHARSFFENHRYPDGFYRRQAPFGVPELTAMLEKTLPVTRILPGHNEGAGNYVVNKQDTGTFCYAYQKQVNFTAALYPNPTPELQAAIKANLVTFYKTMGDPTCKQLFPYGR